MTIQPLQTTFSPSSSPPELSPSASSSRTNTVIITSLPPQFFDPTVIDALREHFSTFGDIHTWAPLKAFARVILVYYEEGDAELAKEHCDNLILGPFPDVPETTLRVFRADPTPLHDLAHKEGSRYLRPPEIEKNFLISPPGSPPVGWEQTREEPPNSSPLALDLMNALKKLHMEQEHADRSHHRKGSVEVLIEPHEGAGIGVYVEDVDGDQDDEVEMDTREEDWVYGQRPPSLTQWRHVTAMPPMPISA